MTPSPFPQPREIRDETADLTRRPSEIAEILRVSRAPEKEPITPAAHIEEQDNSPKWPTLPREARYGLVGEIVNLIEPHSESDPAALVFQHLAMFGNVIGRDPHFGVEADRHALNLFVVCAGATGRGRKGTGFGQNRRFFASIDSAWDQTRVLSGLSSGEGLIHAVRDPLDKQEPIRADGKIVGYQKVQIDPGVEDKRLLVFEPEFSLVLRVCRREGNTLSALLRQAWDSGNLRVLTRNNPIQATNAHISMVGHITIAELRREMDDTAMGNGFGNRILWGCSARSKCLPEDDQRQIDESALSAIIDRLGKAVEFGRWVGEIKRDEKASAAWRAVYRDLTAGIPGLAGSMLSRSDPQVMRIACIYALHDLSSVVRVEHLMAALAVWQYAEESVKFIFGNALGDPVADAILGALRTASDGLTRTEIAGLFGRHKSATQISTALGQLQESALATFQKEQRDGRYAERWRAL